MSHFNGSANHRGGVHLTVAGLKAVQNTLFDGVFKILNLAVMGFQLSAKPFQLTIELRHLGSQLGNRFGRANAGHHIFALCVGEVLAKHHVFACAGVACEAHTRGAVVAHVAEHHGDHIHGCAVGHGGCDFKFSAIIYRALAHPGVEHRLDGDLELFEHIFRKGPAGMLAHHGEKTLAHFFQVAGGEAHIHFHSGLTFDFVKVGIKFFIRYTEGHFAEQLNESAVGIVAKALVARLGN